jgi:hypothetical protein
MGLMGPSTVHDKSNVKFLDTFSKRRAICNHLCTSVQVGKCIYTLVYTIPPEKKKTKQKIRLLNFGIKVMLFLISF